MTSPFHFFNVNMICSESGRNVASFSGFPLTLEIRENEKGFSSQGRIRKFKNFTGKSGNFRSVREKSEKIISENINVYYMKMIKK